MDTDEPTATSDPEATVPDPDARPPGTLVGTVLRERFVLLEQIGRGGMGVVYRARDLRREEARDRKSFIAIKVIGDQLKHKADALVALQREAKRAQQLAHPNIATVYDFDREGDLAYLSMELLTGRGLNELLKASAGKGKPLNEALPIIRGMARGLAYAHQRGIVHADFKPGNVFITDDGAVKILDFGIARVLSIPGQETATQFDGAHWKALTPTYASCEMLEQRDPDARDDIYALACVTYELLAGFHPFERVAATEARDARLVPKPVPGLSRRQNRALRHGLAFDRDERTGSADGFLQELTPRKSAPRLAVGLSLLGLASLAGAALIAGWTWFRLETPLPAGTEPVEPPAAASAAPPPLPMEPMPVDAPTRAKIDRILEVADLHLAMGRLTSPPGSNAAEAYAAVAELQPGNRYAAAGIRAVANRLESEARQLVRQGRRREALDRVAEGLAWAPDHQGLNRLQVDLVE